MLYQLSYRGIFASISLALGYPIRKLYELQGFVDVVSPLLTTSEGRNNFCYSSIVLQAHSYLFKIGYRRRRVHLCFYLCFVKLTDPKGLPNTSRPFHQFLNFLKLHYCKLECPDSNWEHCHPTAACCHYIHIPMKSAPLWTRTRNVRRRRGYSPLRYQFRSPTHEWAVLESNQASLWQEIYSLPRYLYGITTHTTMKFYWIIAIIIAFHINSFLSFQSFFYWQLYLLFVVSFGTHDSIFGGPFEFFKLL